MPALLVFLLSGVLAAVAPQSPSRLVEIELRSEVFGNTRMLRVLLPPGYDDAGESARRYPVVYFTDGIPAVDAGGWNAVGVVRELWSRGELPRLILVAVDNGGSTQESARPVLDRASEFLPWPDPTWTEPPLPEPRGAHFPRFLFDEVAVAVGERFRVDGSREATTVVGASYGAVAALYAALMRPERVGRLLLESPALQVGDGAPIVAAENAERLPLQIAIGVGTAEHEDPRIAAEILDEVRRLHAVLVARLGDERVRLEVVEGHTHWYTEWAARLPAALRFLLAPIAA